MLKRGGEDPQKIKIIISLTRITSRSLIHALVDYYTVGAFNYPPRLIGNFNRALIKIEEVNLKIEKIKELSRDR